MRSHPRHGGRDLVSSVWARLVWHVSGPHAVSASRPLEWRVASRAGAIPPRTYRMSDGQGIPRSQRSPTNDAGLSPDHVEDSRELATARSPAMKMPRERSLSHQLRRAMDRPKTCERRSDTPCRPENNPTGMVATRSDRRTDFVVPSGTCRSNHYLWIRRAIVRNGPANLRRARRDADDTQGGGGGLPAGQGPRAGRATSTARPQEAGGVGRGGAFERLLRKEIREFPSRISAVVPRRGQPPLASSTGPGPRRTARTPAAGSRAALNPPGPSPKNSPRGPSSLPLRGDVPAPTRRP